MSDSGQDSKERRGKLWSSKKLVKPLGGKLGLQTRFWSILWTRRISLRKFIRV